MTCDTAGGRGASRFLVGDINSCSAGGGTTEETSISCGLKLSVQGELVKMLGVFCCCASVKTGFFGAATANLLRSKSFARSATDNKDGSFSLSPKLYFFTGDDDDEEEEAYDDL